MWDMEQFFKAAHIPDGKKVSITCIYPTSDAKLWWRTRMEDDVEYRRPQITAWETLKKEMNDQFLPTNTAWVAREALKKAQTHRICEGLRQGVQFLDARHKEHVR